MVDDRGGVGPISSRQLVPMQIGSATVFLELSKEAASVEADDGIYPVGARGVSEAFDRAGDTLREILRLVDERAKQLEAARPSEITVEFSLTFEATGRASIVPILVTGETGLQTGLRVTAVWRHSEPSKTNNGPSLPGP